MSAYTWELLGWWLGGTSGFVCFLVADHLHENRRARRAARLR